MIETIFYFAKNKAEYDHNANNGNISERTISFVPTGNGVGDIYKDGIKYGSSIDEDELIRIINEKIADGNFNIPFASTSKAGIIKLGKGLKSVGNDGTVDVDFTGLNGIDGLDGLIESILKTIIDKNGTGVVVTPRLSSGTAIADIKVGSTTKTIYAPAGSGGGDNPGGGSEPYDDTDIKNAIKDLQDRANQTESDLRDLLDETEEEVREKFKNAFDTYEDLIDYYKQSGDTTPTKFTFGKEDADEWASQMGLITPNGDGTYNVGWSTLTQSYNSLAGEVAQIKANQSVGGEIDYEALSAGLYSYIDLNAATSGMDSTWGKFVKKDDGEIQMLEWMESAIKTYASNEEAYARLLAAAKDYDENGNTIQEGIAKINAFVEKDSNGNYVAGTSLASMIDDGVNTSLSEVFTENSSNSAVAGLYARLSNVEDTADDNYEAISGLQSKVEEIDGEYIAKADLVSTITNKKDEIISEAGLATKASLEEAKSSLNSKIGNVSASIETCVKKGPDGKIESEAKISANNIYLDGTTWAEIINADSIISNKVTTAYIKGVLDGENMENIWIDADHIYLDGTTWAELINAEQIVADQLESLNIKTSELEVFGNGTKLSINGTNGILLEGQSSNPYHFDIDGSGQFANGAISWNAYGDIKLSSKFINAVNADVSVNSLEAGSSNKVYVDSSYGVYVDGTCDSKINPDGSGYLGNNGNSSAIAWGTDGSGSIANGAISWDTYGSSVALNIPDGDISVGDASSYSQVENNAISVTSGSHGISMMGYTHGSGNPAQLYVYSPASSYRYTPTGPVDGDCDMRKKNVVEDENISIENIADAPLFKYTLKSNPEGLIKIGSSAQYWQNVIPEAVYSDDEGYLSLNYMTINTVASLTSAKEIVKLKEENTALKQRVEALESRLQLIENKLNA